MLFGSVVAIDKSYRISGITSGVPNNTAKGMIVDIDTTGALITYWAIGDSVNANYGLFWNNMLITKDSTLAFTGYYYDSLPSILWGHVSDTGSIEIFRYYFPQSSGFQAYSQIQYGDSCFFILGGRTDSVSGNVDVVLLKTNSQGYLLWQKKYNQYVFDNAARIIELGNGNLLLGAARNNLSQTIQKSNTWLLEVDTGGNFVRQWFDPNDSTYAAEGLLQTQDGGFIYGAQKKYSESGGLISFTNTIVKMTNNFNKQWTYKGGVRSIYTSITDIEQLADGGFIACGQYPVYGTDTALWGCVIRLNANGNVIWERKYRGINVSQTLNFLSDIDVLPDGSLIAVGQCQNSGQVPSQVGWFLKLDSNGCEVENCLIGIDDRPQTTHNIGIQVYPNPASGYVHLEVSNEMLGGEVRVYDVRGKVVKEWRVTSDEWQVDVSDLGKGLYVISATKGENFVRTKLVLE